MKKSLWNWRTNSPPPRIEVLYNSVKFAELEKQGEEFVFRYLPNFSEMGLASLPGLPADKIEHRQRDLFPFFQERIPELGRPEVRAWLEEQRVDQDDVIKLLGVLSKRSVTDSYQLRLFDAA